ncbi:MAG: dTDP-4-dehydrorhamnose reductase [Candidatus Limivicinus sp.]|nr:dTDP-4-dehydrorhamnose reductase [Candidatus Limivicinus sp.]
MKVFVTGASGQLGFDVCLELERRGIEHKGVSSKELDIRDDMAVQRMLEEYRPDAVIHCAAYTQVDRAEDEPEQCFAVNALGTRNIARACGAVGAKLLYISTDYVFPGTGQRPYEPEDETGPLSIYGKSKLEGEKAVKELLDRFFIVRISWAFGVNGGNFIRTMLRLSETHDTVRVVADQVGSPTYTADLALLLCDMIQTEKYGIYHATNEGFCSWAELAEAVFSAAGKGTKVQRVTTEEYGAKAPRPHNSRLSKTRLTERGFSLLPPWQDAVARYLIQDADKKL